MIFFLGGPLETWGLQTGETEDVCEVDLHTLKARPGMSSGRGASCGLIAQKDLHSSALDIASGQGSGAFCTSSAGKLFSKRA